MYPIATAHGAQNRGFISFKITQQVVQTFSNSKPWDKATIFFKALNPEEIWNCCYSKACDGREGSFYLVELLPAQFFWFLFASWSIYLEETQTHMATFRSLGLLTHVHSQISNSFLNEGFHSQLFLSSQATQLPIPKELASRVRSGMQQAGHHQQLSSPVHCFCNQFFTPEVKL